MARLSPWVLAGVGCLGVGALGIVAIGGAGLMISKTVKEELNKPVDKTAILAALKVPLHPKAQFDEELTRGLRLGTITAQKFAQLKMTIAGFTLQTSGDDVLAWYQKTLKEQGYTEKANEGHALRFEKGGELVLIDVPKASQLTITRMKVPGNN